MQFHFPLEISDNALYNSSGRPVGYVITHAIARGYILIVPELNFEYRSQDRFIAVKEVFADYLARHKMFTDTALKAYLSHKKRIAYRYLEEVSSGHS